MESTKSSTFAANNVLDIEPPFIVLSVGWLLFHITRLTTSNWCRCRLVIRTHFSVGALAEVYQR